MSSLPRRSFVKASAAMIAGAAVLHETHAAETIPDFDQTKTDYDKTKVWKPFSDRKIRVGLVGYYAHLSAMKDGETLKVPQYTL